MIKGLRRSIKGDKHTNITHGVPPTPKSGVTIIPPKKIIRAIYDYTPASDQELGFSRGDFFHVVGGDDDPEWYEACNPATNARGMVPVSYFQILGKNTRDSGGSGGSDSKRTDDSGYSPSATSSSDQRASRKSISTKPGGPLYGIVIYNFDAERPDELQASAGEAIIVIAQSNAEWFLAKPIGRLGGPGLIPVSFIEIRDMATGRPVENPEEAIARANVPKVEEWKKQAAEYKNSSISLGKFDFDRTMAESMANMSVADGNHMENHDPELLAPIQASVDSYHFENGRYWYVLAAQMEDGRHWSLCRYYEDFYDFQIALLTAFPKEAGQQGGKRTLPYMPGPVTYVTDTISSQRRASLDEYIKQLLMTPPEISKCHLVRQLFAPRAGDVVTGPQDYNRNNGNPADFAAQNRDSQLSHQSTDSSPGPSRQGSRVDLNGNMRGNGSYPSILSPPPAQKGVSQQQQYQPQHQPNRPSVSSTGANGHGSYGRSSELQPPRMLRADSSMSSNTAASAGSAGGNTSSFMKVKVRFHDDLIAIRLPADITLQQLQERLEQRLDTKLEDYIQYHDKQTGEYYNLISDNDLNTAIQRNPKLVLSV